MTLSELIAGALDIYEEIFEKSYAESYRALWNKYAAIYGLEPVDHPAKKPHLLRPAFMVHPIIAEEVVKLFPSLASEITKKAHYAAAAEEEKIAIQARMLRDMARRNEERRKRFLDIHQKPSPATPPPEPAKPLTIEEQWEVDWAKDPNLRKEFMDHKPTYLAYMKAVAEGKVKIYGG